MRTAIIVLLVTLAHPALGNGCRTPGENGHDWDGQCHKVDPPGRKPAPNGLERVIARSLGPACGPQTGRSCAEKSAPEQR